jgi:RsiW-degrading membrane proteinase PrsW (M82 family)
LIQQYILKEFTQINPIKMKTCEKCGHINDDSAKFCGQCGNSFSTISEEKNQSSWIDHINDYVGNDKPANLNWRVLFTDVLKKHSREEAEEIFICGTKNTTPSKQNIVANWPHPWLYSRVFGVFAAAFFLLYICCVLFGNTNTLPGLIVVGAFTVPLSTLIMFLEINAFKNISVFNLALIFLIGGCASLLTTLALFSCINIQELDYWGALLVGLVEEVGKAIIIYLFVKRLAISNILPCLLVGAAVGAGFAAFESAGYAMNCLFSAGWDIMLDVIFLRGLLTPGVHIAWAAITGSAMAITIKKTNIRSSKILLEKHFLRLFIIPILLHAAWDSPLSNIGSSIYLVPILLTLLVCIVVLILVNMGLNEIMNINTSVDYEEM